MSRNITVQELMDIVKMSTCTKTVCEPSQSYYASGNDWSEHTLEYIDSYTFQACLQSLIELDGA